MDETAVNWYPPLRKCWMKRGEQKRIPVPADTHHRAYVFGACDWLTGNVSYQLHDHANTDAFLAFLEYLLTVQYPDQRLVLVMDNAAYHKGAPTRAWFSLVEHRLLVLYLPAYCSHLNPIERFWLDLKDSICIDTLFATFSDLLLALDLQLQQQNDPASSDRFSFSNYEL
jgi:transposase